MVFQCLLLILFRDALNQNAPLWFQLCCPDAAWPLVIMQLAYREIENNYIKLWALRIMHW